MPASPAFSPDGSMVAVAGWSGVEVYRVPGGAAVARGPGLRPNVYYNLSFAPGGQAIVTWDDQGELRLWRLPGQDGDGGTAKHE